MNWHDTGKQALKTALRTLQDEFAHVDLFSQPSGSSSYRFLVLRYQRIALRMDGSKNHKRAHLHIDYGKEYKKASYAIDTGERLAGALDDRYDEIVHNWIAKNRHALTEAWNITQSGGKPNALIAQLKVSKVD